MSTEAIIALVLFLLLLLAFLIIGLLTFALFDTKKKLRRYQGIIDLEAEQAKVKAVIEQLKTQQDNLEQEEKKIKSEIILRKSELSNLNDEVDIQSHGLYESKYDFDSATRYKVEIDRIRQQQKQMIRDKAAVDFEISLTVEGSKAKGKKMMNEQTKLMLRAFNGECDSLIMKVKYNNVIRIEERIKSVYDSINKLGVSKKCSIIPGYFDLKIKELHIVHEYQEKRQAEIEEQRLIREQIREEQKAQRELEKAQKDAQKEEEAYEKALIQAREEIAMATGDKQAKLQERMGQLQQLLQTAHEKSERAISRAQQTRSGYVYVISNVGSFGEDVYKIGLTRRLEPMDRVKELGDASVPFPFDVHAMIFSKDAPTLEAELHRSFDSKRVNRINQRKEFFNVKLNEIKDVVCQNKGEIEFTLIAEAEEYRKTQLINAS